MNVPFYEHEILRMMADVNSDRIYIETIHGIFVTSDSGENWTQL